MGKEKYIKTNAELPEELMKAVDSGTAWMPNFQGGCV